MTVPLIGASWHRLPEDAFGAGPSKSTPLDPSSSTSFSDDESGSEWSCEDEEELITLDLGTDRIARRALLGYSAGLDSLETETPATSSRNVRNSQGSDASRTKRTTTSNSTEAGGPAASGQHLGAGKMLSLTGLDTNTPLMKINDTVLRGRRMDLFGSEIVLQDSFDPTRPRGQQHRLTPLAPTTSDARPNAASSSTKKRIPFRPIYDPSSRGSNSSHSDALAKLQAIAAVPGVQARSASLVDLTSSALDEEAGEEKRPGRGKYKRKEVSEEEQIIRAAERKARRAAKEFMKQKEEQQQVAQQEQPDAQDMHAEDSQPSQNDNEPRPPPPFDGPR